MGRKWTTPQMNNLQSLRPGKKTFGPYHQRETFTQSSRLGSDDGDEVVPFKNSSADESVSSSPSPMAQSLRATRQAFGSFEGKFDEGEEVIEHVEDYIPQHRSSSKKK